MFLWVTLSLDLLERRRGLTTKRLKELVHELPSGLNEVYDQMLFKIMRENEEAPEVYDLIQRILTYVVLAVTPISLAQLREALAVKPGTRSLNEDEIMRNIRDVQPLCGSFVEIVSSQKTLPQSFESLSLDEEEYLSATVRLVHQSAKDYLLDTHFKLKEPLSMFRIDPLKGHKEIAETCLTYLRYDEFDDERFKNGHDSVAALTKDHDSSYGLITAEMINKRPFIEYACFHWPAHVKQLSPVNGGKDIIRLACEFILDSPNNFENLLRVRSYLTNPENVDCFALSFAATAGLFYLLDAIIERGEIDLNEPDRTGETVLSAVAISAGSDVNDSLKIMQLLIERGATFSHCRCHGRSPLHHAIIHSGQLELCRLLLENGAASEEYDCGRYGLRSFHYVAVCNRVDLIELLLSRCTNDIDVITDGGKTALHLACQYGALGVVKALVRRRASLELITSREYMTALHLAVIDR
ncbi:ankyrin [Wilcoxina mikolae CBS 423.85]|nr:ankyrin [Wilcoxina mikolae CBS 423.85]